MQLTQPMIRFTSTLKLTSLLLMAGLLVACAGPARIEQMAVHDKLSKPVSEELKGSIGRVEVTGGMETNPLWASKVSSDAFQRALEESLKANGFFNPHFSSSQYELTADLLGLDQPAFGLDFTVRSNVRYSLINKKTRKVALTKVISSNHTTKFSEAFAAAQRMQLANEGAIKANIFQLIQELDQFKP
ncbi:hypothetical protein [Limnohabitans sp. DM1]|uniref:hypothetical protein n=1 Tax=Limnohabitans sp. DM1 TaxID=1597955 RepID=UPI000B800633|nr:hypothetical protein [Limnohabitans sp. DM1]